MDFQIRDVQEIDIDALASVFADAYKPEKTGEHWTVDRAREVVAYWYRRAPAGLKILAQRDQEILGAFFADVKPWWDGPRMIEGEFFVRTNCQGAGIGKTLLKTAMIAAKETYHATCFETVTFTPASEYPLKWYKKIGFEEVKNLVVINGPMDAVLNKITD